MQSGKILSCFLIHTVKRKTWTSALLICSLLSSCKQNPAYQLIAGHWKAADWIIEGASTSAENVQFEFRSDKTYHAVLGQSEEEGTFRIESEYLFTKTGDQLEIMVNIEKLTADSMVLGMNRSGQRETLILVRESK